jgi:circadian clock protein KaiB
VKKKTTATTAGKSTARISAKITPKKPVRRAAPGKQPASQKKTAATAPVSNEFWTMRLYVAGQSPRSITAIANLRRICDQHVPGRYAVEIIDLLRNPELAKADQIVAIPTLIKRLPTPVGRIIGDLSATDRVVVSLEMTSRNGGRLWETCTNFAHEESPRAHPNEKT